MASDVLDHRALNRATLARQLLLERTPMAPLAAVEHLIGLQAQVPLNPYHALWSRIEGFDPDAVGRLVLDRALVRIAAMRSTIHLVSAADALVLRPLAQPVLDRELRQHRDHAPVLAGVDLRSVIEFGRELFAEPRTIPQARAAMAEQFPDVDPGALVFACRNNLALIQVPPRGVWGRTAQVTLATAEGWLGRSPVADPSVDEVVLRYLAAFGPALVADAAAWSGLQAMREVFDRLRPRLRTFADERGRELFDLPDAPRPDAGVPAPVRFLPEYDNALLSHADRSRFAADERVRQFWQGRTMGGSVLADGEVRAAWVIERDRDTGAATMVVHHTGLSKRLASAVTVEGRSALRFLEPNASVHDVRLVVPSAA
jgi:Winged helix DNA-binding domain